MRKLLFAIVLLLGVIFFLSRLGEMEAIVETRKSADLRYIFIALIIQAVWFLNLTATFKTIFDSLGIKEKFSVLLILVVSANFANTVTPAAGMGGMALFFSEAKRRNYPTGRVTVAAALFVLFDYLGFICVLLLGLIVLIRRNNLNWSEVLASIVLVTVASTLGFLLYLGTRSGEALGRALAWMAKSVNRFTKPILKREYFSEKRAYEFAYDAEEGLNELSNNPKSMLKPALLALINKALKLLILMLVFISFDAPLSIGTLIAGFSIGYLFLIVSPTPSGIGFVEGALTLALYSMYVPLLVARDITLFYRGITLYLPLLVGMFTFRWLGREDKIEEEILTEAPD